MSKIFALFVLYMLSKKYGNIELRISKFPNVIFIIGNIDESKDIQNHALK